MNVKLLKRAQYDLALIREFHPKNGNEIVSMILSEFIRLVEAPKLGSSLSYKIKIPTDYRYFVIDKWIALYKIKAKDVKIYRIFDARQDWLNQLFR